MPKVRAGSSLQPAASTSGGGSKASNSPSPFTQPAFAATPQQYIAQQATGVTGSAAQPSQSAMAPPIKGRGHQTELQPGQRMSGVKPVEAEALVRV